MKTSLQRDSESKRLAKLAIPLLLSGNDYYSIIERSLARPLREVVA